MSTPQTVESAAAPREQREYQLTHDPDGRSWTARENLADILSRELLGPANGPHEVIEGQPDEAYLVGRIAPVKLSSGSGDPVTAGAGEAGTDIGDATDAKEGRGVPVTAVDDSAAESDDDSTEDTPQQRGLMVSSSMGMRFQVPLDLTEFTITASWGVYHPVTADEGEGDSRVRRFRRSPISIAKTVVVADLIVGQTATIHLRDAVTLKIDRYDDIEWGRALIEVALCNDRETPRKIPVDAWLYQAQLTVESGDDVFLPVQDVLEEARPERDVELRRLNLQYRDRLEFAHGRTCSVDWAVHPGLRRAHRVWTTWLPTCETPQTTAQEIAAATLDMEVLAAADRSALEAGLRPIVTGYADWLAAQRTRADQLPEHLRGDAHELIDEADKVRAQLDVGIAHLLDDSDDEPLRCFQFMNRVMADQRVHSQIAELRAQEPDLTLEEAEERVRDGDHPHSWRTFQLAFILMQLPMLTDPSADKRSGDLAKAQLLFFPTGGGKTEAYLGLAAYTFAIRRRQGIVTTEDGELNGLSGVAVLMRYTLRLLTAQQFQRATTLMCAAEMTRREDSSTWGAEPFRIGLWVGTDVSPKRFDEAEEQLAKVNEGRAYRLTVLQIQRCPWCGTEIGAGQVRAVAANRRIHVYCGDEFAECPFSEGGTAVEGLPVLTVDEEIYRLAPTFVIATVDKFARLAREGHAATMFGYVTKRCDRHGYVHPDYRECSIKDGNEHRAKDGLPAAAVRPVGRLRPPDLIIQDELHLIAGALGTTVGLFEVAVDVMSSWTDAGGRPVRPLVVASTATVRNAADQVRALYGRDVTIFPPQVLDVGNTFFSTEQAVSEEHPGRRYVGVSTTGVRLTTAEVRLAEILLAAGQLLIDRSGVAADPYLTMVGYFNATRELAGMARYMVDDVQTALSKGRPWSLLPRRTGTDYGSLNSGELTSRVASGDITRTLDHMAVRFDPDFDSTQGKRDLNERRARGEKVPTRQVNPYDTILATSMLQVGVDVTRLGLMLMVGQPKNTAEYIQASSRVGRDADRPGLVVSLGNWARPRDLVHFEQFRHFHETFYARVEALSVTPFSVTSMERGLDGALVSAARVLQANRSDGLSPEQNAGRIDAELNAIDEIIDAMVARVLRAADEDAGKLARDRLANARDRWVKRRGYLAGRSLALAYERVWDDGKFGPLMIGAENADGNGGGSDAAPFVVANSMREVQPEVNLLVSPIRERLFIAEPPGAPKWDMPMTDGERK